MKKIIALALFAVVGMLGQAKADGYFTTSSSATVIVATGSNIEITSISIGSGTNLLGDVFAVLVDTLPIGINGPVVDGSTWHGATFSETKFPVSQWIAGPVAAVTTHTAVADLYSTKYLTLPTGEGRNVEKGLALFIIKNSAIGVNPGVVVTVGYRNRSNRWSR